MIFASQVSVTGTAATLLGVVPPGLASVVVTNGSGTVPLYVGAGPAQPGTASPLTGSGVPVAGGGVVPFGQFSTSAGTRLWAQSSSGTIPAGLIISTGT